MIGRDEWRDDLVMRDERLDIEAMRIAARESGKHLDKCF